MPDIVVTDYGSLLYLQTTSGSASSGSPIATVQKLEMPSIENPTIDARNHSTGKYPSKVTSGKINISTLYATLSMGDSYASTLRDAVVSGSALNFMIQYPTANKWYFSAIVSSFAPVAADAGSDNLSSVRVGFDPTGEMLML